MNDDDVRIIHPRKVTKLSYREAEYVDHLGNEHRLSSWKLFKGGVFFSHELPQSPRLKRVSVWVIPEQQLRICAWQVKDDMKTTDDFDFYIDYCTCAWRDELLVMQDNYLDVKVWAGEKLEVDDIDELLLAYKQHELDYRETLEVLRRSYEAVSRLTANGFSIQDFANFPGISLEPNFL